jgi:hypothetical protein
MNRQNNFEGKKGFQVNPSVEMDEPKMRSIDPACSTLKGRGEKSCLGTKIKWTTDLSFREGTISPVSSRHLR